MLTFFSAERMEALCSWIKYYFLSVIAAWNCICLKVLPETQISPVNSHVIVKTVPREAEGMDIFN